MATTDGRGGISGLNPASASPAQQGSSVAFAGMLNGGKHVVHRA